MANERIPVVGTSLVPRHVTWTNYRAIGKTAAEARELYRQMKELESAGAYAAELEVVPHQLASFLSSQTRMLLMSLGSGSGCDTQFLFRAISSATTTNGCRAMPRRTGIFRRRKSGCRKSGSAPFANTSSTWNPASFRPRVT